MKWHIKSGRSFGITKNLPIHCENCGKELGRKNIRLTRHGEKSFCCKCADEYDNKDWVKIYNKLDMIR